MHQVIANLINWLACLPELRVRFARLWEFAPGRRTGDRAGCQGSRLGLRGRGIRWDASPGGARPARPEWARPGWDFVGRTGKKWESADKPGSVESNHPSGTHVAVRLEQPTRKPLRAAGTSPKARALPYLALLQVGFAVPPNVATGAVRSYRTVSPLPSATRRIEPRLGRFAFCCTFRGLAPPRRYLAPCPVEPGLSSAISAAVAWPTPARIVPRAR